MESIATGSETVNDEKYCSIAESNLDKYGAISRICSVMCDNTHICINAISELIREYTGVTRVQDQAYAANLAIEDVIK